MAQQVRDLLKFQAETIADVREGSLRDGWKREKRMRTGILNTTFLMSELRKATEKLRAQVALRSLATFGGGEGGGPYEGIAEADKKKARAARECR